MCAAVRDSTSPPFGLKGVCQETSHQSTKFSPLQVQNARTLTTRMVEDLVILIPARLIICHAARVQAFAAGSKLVNSTAPTRKVSRKFTRLVATNPYWSNKKNHNQCRDKANSVQILIHGRQIYLSKSQTLKIVLIRTEERRSSSLSTINPCLKL
jgi:hypothetical protein